MNCDLCCARPRLVFLIGWLVVSPTCIPGAWSQQAQTPPLPQAVLEQAAMTGQYTFIVFFRDDSPATQQMIKVACDRAAADGEAIVALVRITNSSVQELVQRFDVARAPMPLTAVVAPNGALTGVFPRRLTGAQLADSILSPKMAQSLKSLQDNHLVFVCVQTSHQSAFPPSPPAFVRQMQAHPDYADRLDVILVNANDAKEAIFLKDMGIDPQPIDEVLNVLIAPPGVMVGKFNSGATMEQVATALHQAGKCCDDPNCKHDRAASRHDQRDRK